MRWYLRYPLAYEHVSELLAECGVAVDASLYLALSADLCARTEQALPAASEAYQQELRESGAGDGAAQVVAGVAVAAGKLRAGDAENLAHLEGCPTQREHAPGYPQVNDTPVGLREAVADVPACHTVPIDFRSYRSGHGIWGGIGGVRGRAGGGDAHDRAERSSAVAPGAKTARASTTFTQGA